MSYTTGTINKIELFSDGTFSVKLNGTPAGTQISGWATGYYAGTNAAWRSALLSAWASEKSVTVYGTESAQSGYSAYEAIMQVHLPGA